MVEHNSLSVCFETNSYNRKVFLGIGLSGKIFVRSTCQFRYLLGNLWAVNPLITRSTPSMLTFFILVHSGISTLWNGGQKGKEGRADPKQHGGEWLKMKGKQLGGSHGRLLEPSQQTVVGGRRMSKPYVPYGMKRYRRILVHCQPIG